MPLANNLQCMIFIFFLKREKSFKTKRSLQLLKLVLTIVSWHEADNSELYSFKNPNVWHYFNEQFLQSPAPPDMLLKSSALPKSFCGPSQ